MRKLVIPCTVRYMVISMLLTGLVFCFTATAETARNASQSDAGGSTPKIGSAAPTLELTDLSGKITNLRTYVGDKPVILAFTASWSKSCQDELKDLQELYIKNRSKAEVLSVSFDKKQKDLKNFVEKSGITFPVLLDKKLSCLDKFQILIIPTTFCINRQGIIEKIFVDYDENIKKALNAWLKS